MKDSSFASTISSERIPRPANPSQLAGRHVGFKCVNTHIDFLKETQERTQLSFVNQSVHAQCVLTVHGSGHPAGAAFSNL